MLNINDKFMQIFLWDSMVLRMFQWNSDRSSLINRFFLSPNDKNPTLKIEAKKCFWLLLTLHNFLNNQGAFIKNKSLTFPLIVIKFKLMNFFCASVFIRNVKIRIKWITSQERISIELRSTISLIYAAKTGPKLILFVSFVYLIGSVE